MNLLTLVGVPSLLEGFSRPALESTVCGTPVIGAAVGAIPELVDENAGVLGLPGDVHALAVAMIDLLHDTTRLTGLGRAARKRVVARFDWDSIARRVLGVRKQATST